MADFSSCVCDDGGPTTCCHQNSHHYKSEIQCQIYSNNAWLLMIMIHCLYTVNEATVYKWQPWLMSSLSLLESNTWREKVQSGRRMDDFLPCLDHVGIILFDTLVLPDTSRMHTSINDLLINCNRVGEIKNSLCT